MKCVRCNETTTRLTLRQRYCPRCEREVNNIIDLDSRRQVRRFARAKDLTPVIA